MALVVRDDDGLLVMACFKLFPMSFAYEAEMKTIEWTVTMAASKPWNKLRFSYDALAAVNGIKSSKDPSGWQMRESMLCIRSILMSKGGSLLGMQDLQTCSLISLLK